MYLVRCHLNYSLASGELSLCGLIGDTELRLDLAKYRSTSQKVCAGIVVTFIIVRMREKKDRYS